MFAPVYGSYSNIAGKQEEIEMFDKLEDLLIRLEEILSELQEPDVASDPNRFRKLMKEQSELTPIVEAYDKFLQQKVLLHLHRHQHAFLKTKLSRSL